MKLAGAEIVRARVARIRELLAASGAEALIVTHIPNVFYLTNLMASGAAVVLNADRLVLITDFRYLASAESLLASPFGDPATTLVRVDRTYDQSICEVVMSLGATRIGVEAAHLAVKRFGYLADVLAARGRTLVQTGRIVERVRRRKDAFEIERLREAGRLLAHVLVGVQPMVRSGRSERAVAADVEWGLRQAGFDRAAFDTIVAGGPHSALPHARPGERVLGSGDLVLLDFGGVLDGYCVDLSRTGALGSQDPAAARLLEAVSKAQAAALAVVRPGIRGSAIDTAAREVLGRYDLAEAFGHSTGHGLGLEVHEEPRIGRRLPESDPDHEDEIDPVMESGMVFTVEPGAYLGGFGGVRIEDDVLVTESGCEVLTPAPRHVRFG